jgi:hypothetical protein
MVILVGLTLILDYLPLNQAKRHGQNVIMGHTHRAGRSAHSEASNGVLRRVLHGVEVGHAMDLKQAKYVSTPNWQQAFAIVTENGKNVQVDLITLKRMGLSKFMAAGMDDLDNDIKRTIDDAC